MQSRVGSSLARPSTARTSPRGDASRVGGSGRGTVPKRRDVAVAPIQERVGSAGTSPNAEYLVRLNRALFM
ncbi:hypothetical protein KHP60_23650 [Microvirga sp. 3-52]|uniref:hypothetical protein n=1 Tax=Microvirga sp. 3-52 TaxID=2792425 RepID=UPI001AD39879|nr:hypothetical protein [Microvirga sp. 3-52]MBO1908643.1 hypothetical protein [Microvirga sp. 3-52]MBS7455295.1 hypothetical protein [Microvirga sp. 3-52]